MQTAALPQKGQADPPTPTWRPLPSLMHSQLLEAGVELHVHGVERVQTAPVLYVSAGEGETQGSGQLRGHGKGTGL